VVSGLTPTQKGSIAEAKITAAAVVADIVVARPLVEGRRYDLIFDTGPALFRVQCKYANRKGDVIVVYTGTCRLTPGGYVRTTYTRDEIDFLAVYCPDTDACYVIPVEDVEGRHALHLRLALARNNQRVGVTMAADYVFGAVAQLGERCHGMAEVRGSSPLSSTGPRAA
jgi:hypothetical protein